MWRTAGTKRGSWTERMILTAKPVARNWRSQGENRSDPPLLAETAGPSHPLQDNAPDKERGSVISANLKFIQGNEGDTVISGIFMPRSRSASAFTRGGRRGNPEDRSSQDRIRTSRGQQSDIWRSGISICKRRERSLAPVPHEHLARQVACHDLVLPGKAGLNIMNGTHPFDEKRGMASTRGLFSMVGSTENERMQGTGQT